MKLLLNCDLGELPEMVEDGRQVQLLERIDLANVCCGAHAGSQELTLRTMEQAALAGVRVGAHPGYPDPEHFGRRTLYGVEYGATQVSEMVAEQVGFAMEAAAKSGLSLYHVKPHGALYNEAAADGEVAEAIALGVRKVLRDVFLVGLAKSTMVNVFRRQGFVVLREAFADRRYTDDGFLVPRSEPDALIETASEAVAQAAKLKRVADTICVHGDSEHALQFLDALR